MGKGSERRRRYATAEKRKILQRAREIQRDKMCTMEEAAVELGVPKGNLSKWGKLEGKEAKFWHGTPSQI